jgi:hypothetical protein
MRSRAIFFFIATFWITMNVLLWRVEYGARGSDQSVPADLVWRKILTAPDTSSLNIFQDGERSGFCEFGTSVETEMAKLDESSLPPDGNAFRPGYQIHLSGNTCLGDFTNRIRFDARLLFSARRQWRELNLRISSRTATLEISSLATNQAVHFKFINDGSVSEHDLAFADLRDPSVWLRSFAGNFGGGLFGAMDLPTLPLVATDASQTISWEARRARLNIGHEPVNTYRLETRVLDHPIVIYASTLGEILRVELPGGITASLDDWGK